LILLIQQFEVVLLDISALHSYLHTTKGLNSCKTKLAKTFLLRSGDLKLLACRTNLGYLEEVKLQILHEISFQFYILKNLNTIKAY